MSFWSLLHSPPQVAAPKRPADSGEIHDVLAKLPKLEKAEIGESLGPTTWVASLKEAFSDLLGAQQRPSIVETACSGLGTPTIALKVSVGYDSEL